MLLRRTAVNKALKIALAAFVTVVAAVVTVVAAQMAAASAANRGGTEHDKELLVALAIVMVLAVHLIPAISRNWVSWIVWFGCLICALFSHLTFFTHADLRANDNFAQASARTVGTERQIEMTREALGQIVARPVALVADELAKSTDKRERAALNVELKQGQKAEELRDQLLKLSEVSTKSKVGGAINPVFKNLQAVFGWSGEGISVAIYLFNAICLELFGALIWFLAFQKIHEISTKRTGEVIGVTQASTEDRLIATAAPVNAATQAATDDATPVDLDLTLPVTLSATAAESNATTRTTTPVTQDATTQNSNATFQHLSSGKTNPEDETLVTLKSAVQSGKCKATVNSIREFLGCSQTKAVELRRALAT